MNDVVHLDPETIDELVTLCDNIIEGLRAAHSRADGLVNTSCFGTFESAVQLAEGYARKAKDTPESASERIEQFIDAYTELRDAFAGGGEAFLTAQFEWVRRIHDAEGSQ